MNKQDMEEAAPLLIVALDGRVVAVDVETGEEEWRSDLPGAGLGPVSLGVTKRSVYASAGSRLFRLDYTTGETLWEVRLAGLVGRRSTILLDGDRVYVARGGELTCVTPKGELLWTQGLAGTGTGSAALGVPGNVSQADVVGG